MGLWLGYYPYSNPYVTETVIVNNSGYDYSEPLIVYAETPESSNSGDDGANYALTSEDAAEDVSSPALKSFDKARQSFYMGDYQSALDNVDAAIKDMPRDAVLHEFRALTLFAMGQYQDAAATLYAVLAAGPGWDWTTMIGLYPDVETYTKQLRALESFKRANAQDPAARLVLSYHYLTAGYDDEAKDEVDALVKLTPQDKVAQSLLAQLSPESESDPATQVSAPPTDKPVVTTKQAVGDWNSSRDDGSTFKLSLTNDGEFTWGFSNGDTEQSVQGSYKIDDKGVLTMDTGDQGMIFAQLVADGSKLDFYMLGDTQDQPPLVFVSAG